MYGVAIPTVAGLRNVLEFIGGKYQRALVFNMREEPLVYVNGQPFVLREVERPFMNLEHSGISRERVESMEARLCADVRAEAEQYGGRVLVSRETDDGQVVDVWETLRDGPDAVQTPRAVFEALKADGFAVEMMRVPVTDEKAPKERDCDILAASCAAADEGTALLFHCQMGRGARATRTAPKLAPPAPQRLPARCRRRQRGGNRRTRAGRTTTAMVVATLVKLRLHGQAAKPLPPLPPRAPVGAPDEEPLLRGNYAVVRSLLRVLDAGPAAKEHVDEVIDRCAHMQNLREAILTYRKAISKEVDEKRREVALTRGVEYLERYWVLVAFGAYIQSADFTAAVAAAAGGGARGGGGGFQAWMAARPELHSIVRRMLWRNPMSALAPPAITAGAAGAAGGDQEARATEAVENLLSNRSGMVLGPHTILKEEPYPGIQSAAVPAVIPDAPNFRQAAGGLPIYGLAIAPLTGIEQVLRAVGAGPGDGDAIAVMHNMREVSCRPAAAVRDVPRLPRVPASRPAPHAQEPTVFINGVPHVLRDATRPLGNMQEYSGIDAQRVEEMERRCVRATAQTQPRRRRG